MEISRCPEAVWRRLSQEDESCTFFQTPEWHQIAAEHFKAESSPFLFDFNGQQAVLPLLKKRKAVFDLYFSPFGSYTALISLEQLADDQLEAIQNFLVKKNIDLFSSPFSKNSLHLPDYSENSTYIIPLGNLASGGITKGWKKGHRDDLRMGLKKGVTVRLAQNEKDLSRYYNLYQALCKHWGEDARATYPYSLFEKIWRNLVPSQQAKLWMAEWMGELICAVLVFYHNLHAVAWNSAANPELPRLYANQVIYHAIISDAKNESYSFFDFNPSPGLEGVIKFKEGFGTEQVPFHNYSNQTRLFSTATRIKNKFKSRRLGEERS
ncbi:GNAT family N-acetyltransferase [Fibrobacterota bacterium]